MVSNVTLMYMHLRLSEIFQTEQVEDGWFGRKNLLFLGDLLQLRRPSLQFSFVRAHCQTY